MTSPELLQHVLEQSKQAGLSENVAYIIFAKCIQDNITDFSKVEERVENERIRSRVESLIASRDELSNQLNEIRNLCKHPKDMLTVKNNSNTGNWCPSDDSYWKECKCNVCGHYWTEPQ